VINITSSWQQQAAQLLQLTAGSLGSWVWGMCWLMARSVRHSKASINQLPTICHPGGAG
jgi:hypothetical protein